MARQRRSTKALDRLSVPQLQELLRQRLEGRRDDLTAELAAIDAELAGLEGGGKTAPKRRQRRSATSTKGRAKAIKKTARRKRSTKVAKKKRNTKTAKSTAKAKAVPAKKKAGRAKKQAAKAKVAHSKKKRATPTKKTTAKKRTGRRGGMTIPQAIHRVLSDAGKPMKAVDIRNAIIERKLVKSVKKSFPTQVSIALSKRKEFKRKGRGVYGL